MKNRSLNFTVITASKYTRPHTFGDGDAPVDAMEVLTGLLSTIYKKDKAAIDEILKPGASVADVQGAIATLDKERIKGLGGDADKAQYQKGYTKAKGEVLTAHEDALREEYGIEDKNLKGTDLVNAIVAAKAGEGNAKTEEQIRATPTFIQMEKDMKKKLKDAETAHTTKITELESGYKKETTFAEVGKDAMTIIDGLNLVLPADAKVAANQKGWIIAELKGYEFDKQADGTIVAMKDGVVAKDEHGNTRDFADLVKESALKYFEVKANDGNEGTGAANDPKKPKGVDPKATPGAYPKSVKKPTNFDEYSKIMQDSTIPVADRRVVRDTYQKENGNK